jgi:hypothetical protein
MTKIQTHSQILDTIFRAQADHKSLEVTKDGRVKTASLGTRIVRAYNEHKNGAEWTKNETARISLEVGRKLNEAIARHSTSNAAQATSAKLTALFERSAALGEVPSSAMILRLVGRGSGVGAKEVDQTRVGFRRSDIAEIQLDQKKDWAATSEGKFLKEAGQYFAPGAIGDGNKVKPHLQALLREPSITKGHEVGQTNHFLLDSGQMAAGQGPDGQALANTLDKSKLYNFAVTLNDQGKAVVVLGFEDQKDGSLRGFGRETPKESEPMGHPTLTNPFGGKAIFGGELIFNEQRGGWTINNSSGRYGSGNEAVMTQHGISVDDLMAHTADLLTEINFPLAAINKRAF